MFICAVHRSFHQSFVVDKWVMNCYNRCEVMCHVQKETTLWNYSLVIIIRPLIKGNKIITDLFLTTHRKPSMCLHAGSYLYLRTWTAENWFRDWSSRGGYAAGAVAWPDAGRNEAAYDVAGSGKKAIKKAPLSERTQTKKWPLIFC